MSISGKFIVGQYERPWLNQTLFGLEGVSVTNIPEGYYSSGQDSTGKVKGQLALIPRQFIIAKELSMVFRKGDSSSSRSLDELKVDVSGGFGPFSISASTGISKEQFSSSITNDSITYTFKGPLLFGLISQKMPKFPTLSRVSNQLMPSQNFLTDLWNKTKEVVKNVDWMKIGTQVGTQVAGSLMGGESVDWKKLGKDAATSVGGAVWEGFSASKNLPPLRVDPLQKQMQVQVKNPVTNARFFKDISELEGYEINHIKTLLAVNENQQYAEVFNRLLDIYNRKHKFWGKDPENGFKLKEPMTLSNDVRSELIVVAQKYNVEPFTSIDDDEQDCLIFELSGKDQRLRMNFKTLEAYVSRMSIKITILDSFGKKVEEIPILKKGMIYENQLKENLTGEKLKPFASDVLEILKRIDKPEENLEEGPKK